VGTSSHATQAAAAGFEREALPIRGGGVVVFRLLLDDWARCCLLQLLAAAMDDAPLICRVDAVGDRFKVPLSVTLWNTTQTPAGAGRLHPLPTFTPCLPGLSLVLCRLP
jgi:hypothetical protein